MWEGGTNQGVAAGLAGGGFIGQAVDRAITRANQTTAQGFDRLVGALLELAGAVEMEIGGLKVVFGEDKAGGVLGNSHAVWDSGREVGGILPLREKAGEMEGGIPVGVIG